MPLARWLAKSKPVFSLQDPWLGRYSLGSCADATVGALLVNVDCEPYGDGSTMTSSRPREITKLPASGWRWSTSIAAWQVTASHTARSSHRVRANSVPVASARYHVGHDARGGRTGLS